MAHIQRDDTGAIVGVFANSQPGLSVEIADDDPGLAAFWSAQLASRASEECQRRIYAVASQNCQMNMTAWIASGRATAEDRAAFDAALAWVQSMRAAFAAILARGGAGLADDSSWPPCPPAAAALAARF